MPAYDLPTLAPVMRGDYERIRFEWKTAAGAAQNITGWTFKFTAKLDMSDSTAVLQKDSSMPDNFDIENAELGIGYIIIQSDDLASISYETTLICDLQATDPSGKAVTTRFKLPVEMDITT